MASTGDIWVQMFSCCFHQPQSPTRRRGRHQRMSRIDRSMIGNPTNFVHTGNYNKLILIFFPISYTIVILICFKRSKVVLGVSK